MTRKPVKFDVNPLFNGPSLEQRTRSGSPFRFLPLNEIDVDPDQPRRIFKEEKLAELAASIEENGVLCPILVKVNAGGTYRIVSGERRYRACKLLGLDTIPAVIDQDDDQASESLSKQLVENLQREDLSSMEKALAIHQLRERFSLSVRDIAKALGVSKSLVQRSLEILQLPDDLQAALVAGASESKILLLGKVSDRNERKRLLAELDNLTRSQLELLIAEGTGASEVSHGGTVGSAKREKAPLSIEDKRIVEEIQRSLGTKVHLVRGRRKPVQGKIVIEFYSNEDLDEVYQRLAE